MTEADIKIAAYHECQEICRDAEKTFGDLTAYGAEWVRSRIQGLIEEVEDRECHRKVVEAL